MEAEKLINELQLSAEMILALLAGIPSEEARFKFNPEAWSMLEVLCHLLDEERYDFRKRLDILLHRPGDKWEPIDPQGWVSSQKYNEQELKSTITAFIAERQKSLEWLKSLKTPNFEQDALAPWGSPIKAGDMLAAWVAHDNLHIRQLVELRRAHIENITMPYQTGYAGDW